MDHSVTILNCRYSLIGCSSTSNQINLKSCHRIATLYTVGVILGACYHLIITPNSYLVGASGGCYALIGAQVANFLLNFKEYTIWSKVIRAVILGCFLLADVAMAVIRYFFKAI